MLTIPHRCWVEVDGRALRWNCGSLRSLLPPGTQMMAVVKANAYGHGLVEVAAEFARAGVEWLGVAHLQEGLSLRRAGLSGPILLLSGALPDEIEEAILNRLTLTVSSLSEAESIHGQAVKLDRSVGVHLKVDTGMGRLGCWHEEARPLLEALRSFPRLQLGGLMTHFSCADDDPAFTFKQWERIAPLFHENRDLLRHASNSPALLSGYPFTADMVRSGLALYGLSVVASPQPGAVLPLLRPALTWKSRITQIRQVGPGRTVSYGATYQTNRQETHATVAIGYGDGYARSHSNGAGMLVSGARCPIRGRVTMDQVILDVSSVDCRVGDEVVVLGHQGEAEISALSLAKESQTIPWEILTRISSRVERIHLHFSSAGSLTET